MPPTTTVRKTANERREDVLEAARAEFADRGFSGASTDAIARAAGISQPYLFRLFGTKKELFLAVVAACMDDEYQRFVTASDGLTGDEAVRAIGTSYGAMIKSDPQRLRGQMQTYVACDDPDVRDVVRRGFGRLVEHVETLGVPAHEITAFFAQGMLMNVMASLELPAKGVGWADRLMAP